MKFISYKMKPSNEMIWPFNKEVTSPENSLGSVLDMSSTTSTFST